MDKLIVIGVDTLAGGNAALVLADRCDVVGISRQRGFELQGCRALPVHSDEAEELAEIVAAQRPQWVVYCGASSASSWDVGESYDAGAEAVRVKAVEQAVSQCGGRMTLVSSDAVFAGPRLFHRETFPTAEHRSTATAAVQVEKSLAGSSTLIVRAHLYGWSQQGKTFVEELWRALGEGCPPEASGTRYATPILASDAAELLWQAYRRKLSGLFHLGGAERVSQWQFALALATHCGATMKESHLRAVSATKTLAARSDENSLDSRRLQTALSTKLPLVHEGVSRFVEQARSCYRQRLQGADNENVAELTAA